MRHQLTAQLVSSSASNSNHQSPIMTSTSNKLFHTYENAGFEEQTSKPSNYLVQPNHASITNISTTATTTTTALAAPTLSDNGCINGASTASAMAAVGGCSPGIAVNKTAIESPFQSPIMNDSPTKVSNNSTSNTLGARIFSATDSSGTTRMLTSSRAVSGQNLVTKLITLPGQSSMDSIKEWSVSTFKCTKQLINEKRGIGSITNDNQLQADFEQLRDNRNKLVEMLRAGQQMTNHYTQLVKTQKQLHCLMNEMSMKCFTINKATSNNLKLASKQVVANFSSLGNNLSSSTTTSSSPQHRTASTSAFDHYEDFLPVFDHLPSSNLSLVDDFKKNAIALNIAVKNGEKLIAALNFYCSNLSTLINKTIEDTLITVAQYESARLEYDAERNSLNFISPTAQTSINYSSDKLELARIRYEQLKEDVQIKMKFLEENTIKVMHKQLLLFNGAFASYTNGNSAALDSTLKQFSIK